MKTLEEIKEGVKKKRQPFFATLKEAQESCKSYYEDNGQLRNCTCGTCKVKAIANLRSKYNFHNNETYVERVTDIDGSTEYVCLTESDVEEMLEDIESTISQTKQELIGEIKDKLIMTKERVFWKSDEIVFASYISLKLKPFIFSKTN